MASLGKSGAILVFILSFHYFYSRNIKNLKTPYYEQQHFPS